MGTELNDSQKHGAQDYMTQSTIKDIIKVKIKQFMIFYGLNEQQSIIKKIKN